MRNPKVKVYKRPYMLQLHRGHGNSSEIVMTKFYSRIETVIGKGVVELLLYAQPGDVLEISSSNYGYLIATARISTKTVFGGIQFEFHKDLGIKEMVDGHRIVKDFR